MSTKFVKVSGYDYRERVIYADVTDAPELCTEHGARPIDPTHVNISIGLDPVTAAPTYVRAEILGNPLYPRRLFDKAGLVKRRLSWFPENGPPSNTPDWLLRLIAEHTPPVTDE